MVHTSAIQDGETSKNANMATRRLMLPNSRVVLRPSESLKVPPTREESNPAICFAVVRLAISIVE